MNTKESVTSEEYVILVHGLGRTKLSMSKTGRFLRQQGYHVLNFNYPSTRHRLETLSERYLGPYIQTHCTDPDRPIHFVTHSMGGILVRLHLKHAPLDRLGRVVMLAPPNQGSEVADWLRHLFAYKWLLGPAAQEIGTDAGNLPRQLGPVDFELGVIAGDRSINLINSFKIPGSDDGKVAVERTKVEGMRDFLLVHAPHPFLMRNTEVLQQIDYFLRTGQFKKGSDA